MKVTDASVVRAVQPTQPAEPGRPAPPGRAESGDKVTTSAAVVRVKDVVAQAAAKATGAHAAKLASIEAQVRQGTYRPDPSAIAERILDDAELAARLQAIFRKP